MHDGGKCNEQEKEEDDAGDKRSRRRRKGAGKKGGEEEGKEVSGLFMSGRRGRGMQCARVFLGRAVRPTGAFARAIAGRGASARGPRAPAPSFVRRVGRVAYYYDYYYYYY